MNPFFYDLMQPNHLANLKWLVNPESFSLWEPTAEVERFDTQSLFAAIERDHGLSDSLEGLESLRRTSRLGKYCEYLITHAWQRTLPETESLTAGLQLHHEGRTLGELDFILSSQASPEVTHIELAVKFYLAANFDEQLHAVGPNLKDSWRLKRKHLIENQFPRAHSPQSPLAKLEGELKQAALLPGRIFQPFSGRLDESWMSQEQFLNYNVGEEWVVVPRLCWPAPREAKLLKVLSKTDLMSRLSEVPVMVASVTAGKLIEVGFVVSNDWQQQAISALENNSI
ncbi:DUF1853 family protein [uncultured Umboniibacter sp.]|uniref:DUF1853 family protein n=1 Tax=uncultured Umboniibacter sp. TaxID=1798917 RepID=UPI002626D45F|nr:DUF1853 family protein [uncultured Umboniibacter sp.]